MRALACPWMSGLQADGFFVVRQEIGRIAIDRDASARLEFLSRKASGQHSDSPTTPARFAAMAS
jgi:hypothetical protein